MSLLRPSGKVRIQEKIFDVVSEGEFIEKGITVVIKEIVGNRIIVARKPEDE